MYKCDKLLKDLNNDYEEYNKAIKDYEDAVKVYEDYNKTYGNNVMQYIFDNSTIFEPYNYDKVCGFLDFNYGCFSLSIIEHDSKRWLSKNVEYYDKNGNYFGNYDIEEVQ